MKEIENEDRKNMFRKILKIIVNVYIIHINELKTDLEMEYVNSLIVLLESFGEYKNNYFVQFMFETNDGKPAFDKLANEFTKLKIDINFKGSNKNKLILINSLANCLIEYIENPNVKINYEGDKRKSLDGNYKASKIAGECG